MMKELKLLKTSLLRIYLSQTKFLHRRMDMQDIPRTEKFYVSFESFSGLVNHRRIKYEVWLPELCYDYDYV